VAHEREAVTAVLSLALLTPRSVVVDGESDRASPDAAGNIDHVCPGLVWMFDRVRERFRAGKHHVEDLIASRTEFVQPEIKTLA
jgi:hypothetical protein